jgi:hypothetical protein
LPARKILEGVTTADEVLKVTAAFMPANHN